MEYGRVFGGAPNLLPFETALGHMHWITLTLYNPRVSGLVRSFALTVPQNGHSRKVEVIVANISYALLQMPRLERLAFFGKGIDTQTLLFKFRNKRFPWVKNLRLADLAGNREFLMSFLASFPNLRYLTLELNSVNFGRLDIEAMHAVLAHCPRLEELAGLPSDAVNLCPQLILDNHKHNSLKTLMVFDTRHSVSWKSHTASGAKTVVALNVERLGAFTSLTELIVCIRMKKRKSQKGWMDTPAIKNLKSRMEILLRKSLEKSQADEAAMLSIGNCAGSTLDCIIEYVRV